MCQYSAASDGELAGCPNNWHHIHYGARAAGGVGMVIVEATAVNAAGRISPFDLCLDDDRKIPAFAELAKLINEGGAVAAIQLGHAGRKASCSPGGKSLIPEDSDIGGIGWHVVAPSAIPFSENHEIPIGLSLPEISNIADDFVEAARRAYAAGFVAVQIHAAHGYLLHQFLSPFTNQRTDEYGGSLENRARLLLDIARRIRGEAGDKCAVIVRISATDWIPAEDPRESLGVDEMVTVCKWLKDAGVDMIDVSTGGLVSDVDVPVGPGYQVPFSREMREQVDLPVTAVGMIAEPLQAEQILLNNSADVIEVGRALLTDPSLPIAWANKLGEPAPLPEQYSRGSLRN